MARSKKRGQNVNRVVGTKKGRGGAGKGDGQQTSEGWVPQLMASHPQMGNFHWLMILAAGTNMVTFIIQGAIIITG